MARFLALGFVLLLSLLSSPAYADQAGSMRYNPTDKQMEFYDGSAWYNLALTVPLGSCTEEGSMDFDTILSSYKFCNGTSWVRVLGVVTLAACTQKGEMEFSSGSYFVCNGLLWTNIKGAFASV